MVDAALATPVEWPATMAASAIPGDRQCHARILVHPMARGAARACRVLRAQTREGMLDRAAVTEAAERTDVHQAPLAERIAVHQHRLMIAAVTVAQHLHTAGVRGRHTAGVLLRRTVGILLRHTVAADRCRPMAVAALRLLIAAEAKAERHQEVERLLIMAAVAVMPAVDPA